MFFSDKKQYFLLKYPCYFNTSKCYSTKVQNKINISHKQHALVISFILELYKYLLLNVKHFVLSMQKIVFVTSTMLFKGKVFLKIRK